MIAFVAHLKLGEGKAALIMMRQGPVIPYCQLSPVSK
jgi:hypothetical protein